MKIVFLASIIILFSAVTLTAQSINFEPSTVITGQLDDFSNPDPAGIALKATYPQIHDWEDDLKIQIVGTRNSIDYNKALKFEDDDSWIEFGPLSAGSFMFTMLTVTTNGNNYTQCKVKVYNSFDVQQGNTEYFEVDNPNDNGAAFCMVAELVPANGYVKIKAVDNETYCEFFIDEISGAGGALPVELTSFRSYLKNDIVELQWTTATELNNFGFDIERSADGSSWTTLGFVEGFGTTSSPKQYSFRDSRLDNSSGELYYRLKQMDRDGSSEYSDVLRVALSAPTSVQLSAYPQPFAGNLNVDLSSQNGEQVRVTLYNSLMQKVATVYDGTVDGSMTMTVPTTDLRDGSYFLVLQHANGEASMQKMLHFQNK